MATQRLETRLTARDETQRAFRTLNSNLNTVNTAFVNVAKVAGALGAVFAGVFIRDLVEVNKQFQSLKASLVTFTGSVENADGAFKILKDFAKETPFSLQEVVGSFNLFGFAGHSTDRISTYDHSPTSPAVHRNPSCNSPKRWRMRLMGEFERIKRVRH